MNDDVPKHSEPAIAVVSDRQRRPLPGPQARALAQLAEATMAGEGVVSSELSLSFVDPDEMAELHQDYMGDPEPTDVLSFALGEDGLLGDVIVCPEVAAGNNRDRDAELRLLVVHGTLHLLGYDHEGEDDRAVMWTKQEGYSGVASP
jgi:rRNA maturation RNase YbeY